MLELDVPQHDRNIDDVSRSFADRYNHQIDKTVFNGHFWLVPVVQLKSDGASKFLCLIFVRKCAWCKSRIADVDSGK